MQHKTDRSSSLAREYRHIFSLVGLTWLIAAVVIASPSLLLPFYPEEAPLAWSWVVPAGLLGGLGALLWRALHAPQPPTLRVAHGMIIVVFAWSGALVAGAAPFVFALGLDPVQALFESTSGWTTTGLSVVDVTRTPRTILFLRSALELAGGAGLAILMIAFMGGPAGRGLATAEGRADQALPHVRASTRLVVTLYAAYALVGTVALTLAGMDLFDAVNHAFAAISTGGFSTRVESIGAWDSTAVEAVTIVLMLLGTTNFVTALHLFRGRLRTLAEQGELRLMAALIPITVAIVLFGVTLPLYPEAPKALRVAIFEVVSALSTTGFSTVGYADWSGLGIITLIVLMLIGGGAGSTAGGLKQLRVYMLARVVAWSLRGALLPSGAASRPRYRQDGQWRTWEPDDILRTAAFVFAFLVTFTAGAAAMSAWGYPLKDALFEMASTLGTVGLSVGVTSPDAPPAMLLMQTLAMLLGRLEFFVIFIGIGRLSQDAHFALQRRRSSAH